ncbi:MAG: class I adenylate-forming enzyme family protein [Dongiaceae bacterium]
MSAAGNVADAIRSWAAQTPWAPALIGPRHVLHYRTLDQAIDRAARGLAGFGLAAGDRVGLSLPGRAPAYLVIVYALARLGAPAMLLPLHEPAAFRAALARRFGLAAVIGEDAAAALPGLPLLAPDPGWLEAAAAPAPAAPGHPGGAHAWLLCLSSGTTAAPKAMARSHDAQRLISAAGRRHNGGGRDDRLLTITALHFTYGLCNAMQVLDGGGTVRLAGGELDVARLCAVVDREQINRLALTPDHVAALLRSLPAEDAPRFPGLKDLTVSSAPLPEAMRAPVRRRIAPTLSITYGSNECWYITRADAAAQRAFPETVGFAYDDVTLEIADEDGRTLPAGAVGQVRLRCPSLPDGYLDDPEATARSFRGGWYHPGDLGLLSPEGALFLRGRVDDAMVVSGVKAYPADIEAVLLAHPAVAEAAAFPVRGAWGDVAAAAVVLRAPVEPAALIAFCRARLGPRAPAEILLRDSLPRSAIGKVLRRRLAADHATSAAGGGSPGAG